MANSALSEIQTANLTANTTASTASTGLSNQFGSIGQLGQIDTGGTQFLFWNIGATELAGMNVEKTDAMKAAIREYVESVNAVLAKLDTLEANEAFGHKIGAVVKDYVKSVKNACTALNSNLEAFSEDLTAIKQTYMAKADSMTSSINNTSSEMDSAASQYKYSGGSN